MVVNKSNVAKFIVSETHTKNFIASEQYKSQDFILGVEYVLANLEKVFGITTNEEKNVDVEKANFEIMEILNDLYK